jgi:hypothetical protein
MLVPLAENFVSHWWFPVAGNIPVGRVVFHEIGTEYKPNTGNLYWRECADSE